MAGKRILIALIPAKAALAALFLLLSVDAAPPLFGLYLSLAAWLFVLSLIVLPYVIFKPTGTVRLPRDAYASLDDASDRPLRPRRIVTGPFGSF